MNPTIDKYIERINYTGHTWDEIEEAVKKKWSKIIESWRNSRDIEAEAYIDLLEAKKPIDYREAYIELQLLTNTILVRYTRRKYTRLEDIESTITVLGEIKTGTPPPHTHGHSHEIREATIKWYNDILEYLQVTNQEKQLYQKLVNENYERIKEAIEYTRETPETNYLVILHGETEESTPGATVMKHVGAHMVKEKTYLVYIEEHQRHNMIYHYYFRLGEIIVE